MDENTKKYVIIGVAIVIIVAMLAVTAVVITTQQNSQTSTVNTAVNTAQTNTESSSSSQQSTSDTSSSSGSSYISEDEARESAINYYENGYGYESVNTGDVYLTTTYDGGVEVYSVEVLVADAGAGSLDQTVYVGAYDGKIYSAGGIEIYG